MNTSVCTYSSKDKEEIAVSKLTGSLFIKKIFGIYFAGHTAEKFQLNVLARRNGMWVSHYFCEMNLGRDFHDKSKTCRS